MLRILAVAAIVIVAVLHVGFFVLESFLWTKPVGRRIFRLTPEVAESSASLALNQGLYNAFLASGLIWSLLSGNCSFGIKVFFLSCVIVAGIVGGVTAKRSIIVIQGIPGAVALCLVLIARG